MDQWHSSRAAALAHALDDLELLPYSDPSAAMEPALAAERTAAELGDDTLRMRALLVQADARGRQGHNVAAGRMAREVNRWARDRAPEQAYVQARSHRILASFFERIDESTTFLEHATLANELLPANAPLPIRVDHHMTVAIAQSRTPAMSSRAYETFTELEPLVAALHEPQRHVTVVHFRASTALACGEILLAAAAVQRLLDLAEQYLEPLTPTALDTIARVAAAQGRTADAESYLMPLLRVQSQAAATHPVAVAEALLTLAEVQRRAGALPRAQASLSRSQELAAAHNVRSLLLRTSREQADLYADAGCWQEAYTEAVSYIYRLHEQFAAEVVSRAAVMQAFFDSEQAQLATEQFREMALRDPLTSLFNRRHLDAQLTNLLATHAHTGSSVGVAFVDLDHFKRINDECSHASGDQVLQHLAAILVRTIAATGFVVRMGGEEFLVVLPGFNRDGVLAVCERIQAAVRLYDWSPITGSTPVRASIGIAATAGTGLSQAELLASADQNLHAAKDAGRDRIVG